MTHLTQPSITSPLFETDAYKLDHRRQYPEGTEYVYSNYTNRGSRIDGVTHVIHFGLQAFLQNFCIEEFQAFFDADENTAVAEYEAVVNGVLGRSVGTDHIRELHKLGYLPLRFSAVPEGTPVPIRVPSFTVENTLPGFFWVTNYIETILSAEYWQASTSATIANEYRTILEEAAEATGGVVEAIDWQLHDFSFRGMTGREAAAKSGAAHLLSFTGSDSLTSIDFVRRYYDGDNGLVLGSVPATEHSVMCAGGEDDEQATYARLLDLYPTGIVSVVSDTWDLWNVLRSILPNLKDQIMARDGKLVIRPDSGDPVDILTGEKSGSIIGLNYMKDRRDSYKRQMKSLLEYPYPEDLGVVEILWEVFGGTINEKGFKVLDPHIGVIYGDSITMDRARQITKRLAAKGFASTNVVFGVGSFTYQYQTRDTFGSAMKATWVQINGDGKAIQKNPVTDNGLKKSAAGRLAVVYNEEGELTLIQNATPEQEAESELKPVWEDGEFLQYQSFGNVRAVLKQARAHKSYK